LGNALKFTENGKIKLIVYKDISIEKLFFEIEDTGIGISEENLKSITDPFVQEDLGYSKQYQGTGLGLAIAERLAKMLGGGIEIQSKKGIGTVVKIDIDYKKS